MILLVVLAIGVYFGFTKHIPFKHGFRLKAQFGTAVNIRPKSPVRIAGINVGKVSSIKREGTTGLVTMEIESRGLPIHEDATRQDPPARVPRRQLVRRTAAGSPSAKTVSSGYTIPLAQTADPVQLDQVLNALNTDTRTNLQNFLIYYGEALTRKPTRRKRRTGTGTARPQRRAGAQPGDPARPACPARHRDHQPGDHRHRTARPLQTDREHRHRDRGAQRARAGSRRTDRQLQHLLRLARVAVDESHAARRRAAHHADPDRLGPRLALGAAGPPTRPSRTTSCRA